MKDQCLFKHDFTFLPTFPVTSFKFGVPRYSSPPTPSTTHFSTLTPIEIQQSTPPFLHITPILNFLTKHQFDLSKKISLIACHFSKGQRSLHAIQRNLEEDFIPALFGNLGIHVGPQHRAVKSKTQVAVLAFPTQNLGITIELQIYISIYFTCVSEAFCIFVVSLTCLK